MQEQTLGPPHPGGAEGRRALPGVPGGAAGRQPPGGQQMGGRYQRAGAGEPDRHEARIFGVTIGALLGVEPGGGGTSRGRGRGDLRRWGEELSGRELAAVEAIVQKYLEAARRPRWSRRKKLARGGRGLCRRAADRPGSEWHLLLSGAPAGSGSGSGKLRPEQRQQPDRVPHRPALRPAGGAEQPYQRLYHPDSGL